MISLQSKIQNPKSKIIIDGLLGLSLFALYFFTLSPSVLTADNGEFQLVAWKLGIAHPPGYPLYTMVGWLFSRFFVSPAFALNLLSAILAALTLVIISRTVRALTGSITAGILAASLLGVSTTFWAQATTANIRMPTAFFTAFKLDLNQQTIDQLKALTYTTPNGFTIPEDNVSKGMEYELYANPVRGLRLTMNASKSEAVRNNVGDLELNNLVTKINTLLNTTAAGNLRNGTGSTATTALQNWNANFWASWLSVKGQEGNAVPELRKWRANLIANYSFSNGFLKGVNVGMGYRWQDRVIIGYKPNYFIGTTQTTNAFLATSAKFDLNNPYYGPSETNIDLWVGYRMKLTKKITYNVQLNVRNLGKSDSLIPVTVQPDGTVASWRIAPTQVWSITNTFEF